MKTITTELQYSDSYWYDHPLLEDFMKYRAIELIKEDKLLKQWDAEELAESLVYSLSYSQGDGVSFRKWWYTHTLTYGKNFKEVSFYIETNSYSRHYCHEKTFAVWFEITNSSSYCIDLTDKEKEKMQKLADDYTEALQDICYQLEKYWYDIIEQEDEDNILWGAFNRWKEENNIEDGTDLWDLSYDTKEQDGYTLIATSGDTNIDGLWVALPELQQQTKENTYFTFS